MKNYDVVVIGAGAGGYKAALMLCKSGFKTLLIEKSKEKIGGVCLNEGCIPAKTYLQSAELFLKTKWYSELGIELELKGFDLQKLKNKSKDLKDEIRTGVSWLLEQAGVECIYADAVFKDKDTIEVNDLSIGFKKCIIATGSVIRRDPLLPIDGKYIISSHEVFQLEKLPESITIIGGGAIGCEFAVFFNALGVDVTMVSKKEYLIPNQDIDISKALMREFKKRGIKIITFSKVSKMQIKNNRVVLNMNMDNESTIESDMVLLAIGRDPNSKELGLENTDVKVDEKGFVKVNEIFETKQKNIYAIGDCISTLSYAHVASSEAKTVAFNIINNEAIINNSVVPSVVFTIPQIASCGINEKEAKKKNIDVSINKNYYKANPKAKILGDDAGFIKFIIDSKSDEVLGASIVGVEASELIHIITVAIDNNIKYEQLKNSIYAHPTVSEIIAQ